MRKESGFTLIELMVAISVLAILLTVGVPSMQDFVRNNRRAAAVNSLVTDVQRARSTAAGKGTNVVLCHSSNGTGCSEEASPDWAEGWISFVDDDNDGIFDSGETLLSVNSGRSGVTMSANTTKLRFNPGFRSMSSLGGTIAVCVDGSDNDRWIVVSASGRPRLEKESGSVSCP